MEVRRLFTSDECSRSELAWGVRTGQWQRVQRAAYAEGSEPITNLDRERARVLVSGSPARGALAGVLHGLDAVELDGRPTRRGRLPPGRLVTLHGTPCANGVQTMLDLAPLLDDHRWEQALESALRKRRVTIAELDATPPWTAGLPRIRRVLSQRPAGAPPTESLLETLALQLARPILGEPVRQHRVLRADGTFVARVDLCWPRLGLFLELDGQHHEGQPVYDARRETAVVAATGWLPGRFTWREIVYIPRSTSRRLAELAEQAARRPAA